MGKFDSTAVVPHSGQRKNGAEESEGAIEPVKKGGGRGIKAVQSSKEETVTKTKDGATTESKTKTKAQKLYKASSNEHVETKVMTEDNRTTRKKDGTVIVTSTTSLKKVHYL